MKNWLIRLLVKWMTPRLRFIYHNPALWRYVESKGYHVTPVHFYQPIPDTQSLDEVYRPVSEMPGIEWNEAVQLRLLREVFPQYADEYRQFYRDFRADHRFAGRTLEFIGHDPFVYHCMIRHFKPATVVEVGAGFSTKVAANAAGLNGETKVAAIEPYSNDFLASLAGDIQHIKQTAQQTSVSFFERLRPKDILFIDSSHVAHTGSDVPYLVLEVLPRLSPGVIVHFHDIFLPFEYPRHWLEQRRLFWNEQYMVQAYLIQNRRAQILFGNRYMIEHHRDLMLGAYAGSDGHGGGSLWFQV